MKLTIVIPIYNVEPYIEKCVMSCIKQNVRLGVDYEIICVNDGTKDRSADIASDIAKCYQGIEIINQENGGLSRARNKGMENAKGDYIWFVDSDDWVAENCLGRICSKMVDKPDIIQLQYAMAYDDSTKNSLGVDCRIDGCVEGKKMLKKLPAPTQFSVYRREFLEKYNLKFMPGILHEDSEFKPRVLFLANRVVSDDEVSYYYYQRQLGSIMSKFTIKNANGLIAAVDSLMAFSENIDKESKEAFNDIISTNMNTLFMVYRSLNKSEKDDVRKKLATRKSIFKRMRSSHNKKYISEGIVFGINIRLGFFVHKLMR